MSGRALLVVLACAGCDPVVEGIVLDLVDASGDCDMEELAPVMTISVEGIADNGRCRTDHGCVDGVTDTRSVEDLEAAMRAVNDPSQPLIVIDLEGTERIAINGRPLDNCFPLMSDENEPIVCGNANLDDRRDGVLQVELECGACSDGPTLCSP